MSKKVLIVDDTKSVRMFEKLLLKPEGYVVEEVSCGEDALKHIARSRPDAILMDVLMPGMNGIECTRQIKANPDTQGVQIIMLTTRGEQHQIDEAFAAGCDEYVTKPIRKTELIAKLRLALKRQGGGG